MPAHGYKERDFLSWVADGHHSRAAEWLVQRYADEVMGMCMAVVRDRPTAEDLVQDVFSRAFVGLSGFRAEASARTWLLTITRNRCFDHLRHRRRQPWGIADPDAAVDPDAVPEEVPLPAELLTRRADVETALDQLAEGDRALIVLRFRSGLDYAELALAFGIKAGTARMRVSRALQKMRRALEEREVRERARTQELAALRREAPPEVSDDLEQGGLAEQEEVEQIFEEEFEELASEELADDELDEADAPDEEPIAPEPLAERRAPMRRAPAPAPAPGPVAPAPAPAPRRPGGPPPPQAAMGPDPAQPLGDYFAATLGALSSTLRARLVTRARQL
jgi:RNA polymerase sigma-70 factor (ECF subfamily)